MLRALIVGTEWREVEWLPATVSGAGFAISEAANLEKARLELAQEPIDLVLTDEQLADGTALDLLPALDRRPNTALLVMAAATRIAALAEAGVASLARPLRQAQLEAAAGRLAEAVRLRRLETRRREELRRSGRLGPLIGRSRAMQRVYERILRAAAIPLPVFLTGATGTGKTLIARTIHELSPRAGGPFVLVARSSLPAGTAGWGTAHELFERARGGTLLLEEVGELAAELQAALLDRLDRNEGGPNGRGRSEPEVRVITATNFSLEGALVEERLRADLLYRLLVFPIALPPLRERRGDVDLLAGQRLRELNRTAGTHRRLTDGAHLRLRRHTWPGNVRELHNVIDRAFRLASGHIDEASLALSDVSPSSNDTVRVPVRVGIPIAEAERQLILATLEHLGGDKKRAARTLGISLKTLYNRLNEYARS